MSDVDTYREVWSLLDADRALSKAETPEEWRAALTEALDALIAEPFVAISNRDKDRGSSLETLVEDKVPKLVTS